MMDFVYMCRPGHNEELRYSIRSVVENYELESNVWVVGDKPDWYIGDFIKTRPVGNAYENVRNNLRYVLDNNNISDDFVLMNDDFFILRKLNSVSHYHGGLLINRAERHEDLAGPNFYANFLRRTDTVLKKRGIKEPLNYELHVPMQFNKDKLRETIDYPYSIRSSYGNLHGIGGEQIDDVKIYSHPQFRDSSSVIENGTPYLSTDDGAFEEMVSYFAELFPTASKYES